MIEVLTVLTKEVISKYSVFNLFRNKLALIAAPLVLLAISILLLILNSENIVLPVIGISLAVIAPLAMVLINSLFIKMLYKTGRTQEDPYMKFFFNQNNFEFENNLGGLVTTSVLTYDYIYKCYETKDYFYLYINKNYAYIVDKKSFQNGTALELSDLFKFNCKKFKGMLKK